MLYAILIVVILALAYLARKPLKALWDDGETELGAADEKKIADGKEPPKP
ncbi:MAG: hypothetical protein JSS52_00830 [Proteobacteria bacterium]|nr:hypothetical protein [Pseudomonadota bacterium]